MNTEIPVFRPVVPVSIAPPPTKKMARLTKHADIEIEYGKFGYARFRVWLNGWDTGDGWTEDTPREQCQEISLRFLLRETERALPILRAMVEALPQTGGIIHEQESDKAMCDETNPGVENAPHAVAS
jgi:hypothetical protein